MMTRIATGSLLTITLLSPCHVAGYEEETHRALSLAAYDLSSVSSVLHSIYGIAPIDTFKGRLPFFLMGQPRTAAEWITFGGSAEDVPAWRVLNHFYDPISGAGTDILGAVPAPDWALEEAGDLAGQEHSYRDARNAFYNGLTRRTQEGRERELGHAFYALGHVIHMIQDMAQPQHTRGDLHPPYSPLASFIEEYVDDNILSFTLGGARIPDVARARDLWTTGQSGRGLADFSNAHFVSAGTNFTALQDGATAERYRSPRLDPALRDIVSPPDSCKDGVRAPGPLTFFANTFPDPVVDLVHTNTRMTTYSVFDQHLIDRGRGLVFALNCFNLDAAGDILLPRAVASSAALLKYFFRGRLRVHSELTFTASGLATGLRIVNQTPGEEMEGTFTLFYDTAGGIRKELARWARTLPPNDPSASGLLTVPPTSDSPGEPGRYLLVFRGRLGEEPDAVVGSWVGLAFTTFVQRRTGSGGPPLDSSFAFPIELPLTEPIILAAGVGREENPLGPQYPGWAESAVSSGIYRDPRTLPGNTAIVTSFGGACLRRILTSLSPLEYTNEIGPSSAQLVELDPPRTIEDLNEYRWPGPPVIRGLADVGPGEATFEVPVGGARFIGLILTSAPPPGGGLGYQNSCGMAIAVEFAER